MGSGLQTSFYRAKNKSDPITLEPICCGDNDSLRNLGQGEIGSEMGGERSLTRIVRVLRREGGRGEPVVRGEGGGAHQGGEGGGEGVAGPHGHGGEASGERRWERGGRTGEGGFSEENPWSV